MDEEERTILRIYDLTSLIKAKDSNWLYAQEGLVQLGDLSIPALTEMSKNKDRFVRHVAINALAKIGSSNALFPLMMALNDSNEWNQNSAYHSLVKLLENTQFLVQLDDFDKNLDVAYKTLLSQHSPRNASFQLSFGLLKKLIADSRNSFSRDKRLHLSYRPKPPKRGSVYQKLRVKLHV